MLERNIHRGIKVFCNFDTFRVIINIHTYITLFDNSLSLSSILVDSGIL